MTDLATMRERVEKGLCTCCGLEWPDRETREERAAKGLCPCCGLAWHPELHNDPDDPRNAVHACPACLETSSLLVDEPGGGPDVARRLAERIERCAGCKEKAGAYREAVAVYAAKLEAGVCDHGKAIPNVARSIFGNYCACCLAWMGPRKSRLCADCEPAR